MKAVQSPLASKKCIPCSGGIPPLNSQDQHRLLEELDGGWKIERGHHLIKEFDFPDFRQALCFTNRIGEVAEREGHHPDIYLSWGKVKVLIWTHKIDGLTESDFILAAKCELENNNLIGEKACF